MWVIVLLLCALLVVQLYILFLLREVVNCCKNAEEDRKSASSEEIEDELYNAAVEIVTQTGRASASYLQRRLRIGYTRAARLLDLLEENGIIEYDLAREKLVVADTSKNRE